MAMLDFTKLWDRSYLLGPNPLDLSRSDTIFFWVSLVFLVVAVVGKVIALRAPADGPKRYLFNRFFHLFLTIGIFTLVWVGTRFENIPWLSAHIVVLILFLIWFTWLVFIALFYFQKYRYSQRQWEDEAVKQKYLTKK